MQLESTSFSLFSQDAQYNLQEHPLKKKNIQNATKFRQQYVKPLSRLHLAKAALIQGFLKFQDRLVHFHFVQRMVDK